MSPRNKMLIKDKLNNHDKHVKIIDDVRNVGQNVKKTFVITPYKDNQNIRVNKNY